MSKHILAALCMTALVSTVHAGGKGMNGVQQQVQVAADGGKVIVRVSVENGSAKPVYVPKAVYASGELLGRVFQVTNLDTGLDIDYIGPMVKRGPYTRDDFLAVKPGGKLANSIDITNSYAFQAGTHKYRLEYAGSYLGDVVRLDDATPVAVAPATFTYTAP